MVSLFCEAGGGSVFERYRDHAAAVGPCLFLAFFLPSFVLVRLSSDSSDGLRDLSVACHVGVRLVYSRLLKRRFLAFVSSAVNCLLGDGWGGGVFRFPACLDHFRTEDHIQATV